MAVGYVITRDYQNLVLHGDSYSLKHKKMPLTEAFFYSTRYLLSKKITHISKVVLLIFVEISRNRLFILLNGLLVIRSYFYSMVVPFLNGVFFGLMLIFVFGPTFFALIQTSIQQGVKRSLLFILGAFFIDFLFVRRFTLRIIRLIE